MSAISVILQPHAINEHGLRVTAVPLTRLRTSVRNEIGDPAIVPFDVWRRACRRDCLQQAAGGGGGGG